MEYTVRSGPVRPASDSGAGVDYRSVHTSEKHDRRLVGCFITVVCRKVARPNVSSEEITRSTANRPLSEFGEIPPSLIVGSHTAAADCNVTSIALSGGLDATFRSRGVEAFLRSRSERLNRSRCLSLRHTSIRCFGSRSPSRLCSYHSPWRNLRC